MLASYVVPRRESPPCHPLYQRPLWTRFGSIILLMANALWERENFSAAQSLGYKDDIDLRGPTATFPWHSQSSTLKSHGGRKTRTPNLKSSKLLPHLPHPSQIHCDLRLLGLTPETMSISGLHQRRWKPQSHRQTSLSCQLRFGRRLSISCTGLSVTDAVL